MKLSLISITGTTQYNIYIRGSTNLARLLKELFRSAQNYEDGDYLAIVHNETEAIDEFSFTLYINGDYMKIMDTPVQTGISRHEP